MKRFIAIALCFVLTACVLVGCGRTKDKKTTDTTETPTTMTTHATNATPPARERILPSISSPHQETSEPHSKPNDGGDNFDNSTGQSHDHSPTVSSGSR